MFQIRKMKTIAKKSAVVFLGLFIIVGSLKAQSNNAGQEVSDDINTITTAVPFLLIAPDARSGALGDAGVASTPDANSLHWNPSKLAFVEKSLGFSISYTPWLRQLVPDINLAYLSGYRKLDKNQAFGASLLYFSLGDITFTDNVGNVTGQFRPKEFAVDVSYARKLSDDFSGAFSMRYIYSNLTGGATVEGSASHPGMSVAADLSGYYQKELDIAKHEALLAFGAHISNIGSKISYTETGNQDFIPTNLRLGTSAKMDLDQYNTLGLLLDFNKLLVPTPPVYETDSAGRPIYDSDGNPVILLGKDPNVSVVSGIFNSFTDAPGGFEEEIREFTYSVGLEYWYDKQFALRAGYFHEHATKGNRKFFTIGAGLKYSVFGLDFAYLIPTEQRNPLENTLRFSLLFDFDAFKAQNKTSE